MNVVVNLSIDDHITPFAKIIRASILAYQRDAELPADLAVHKAQFSGGGANGVLTMLPSPTLLRWLADYIDAARRDEH